MAIRNYLKVFADGHTEATKFRPLFQKGERERAYAGENPDVLVDGKWWNSTNGDAIYENDFSNSIAEWVGIDMTLSLESGTLKSLQPTTTDGYVYTSISTEIGKKYTFTDNVNTSNLRSFRVGTTINGSEVYSYVNETGSKNNTITFTATSSTTYLTYSSGQNGQFVIIDNISVYETEIIPDAVYPTQFTYMAKDDKLASFLIAGGQPVDITYEYDSPSIVQNVIQAKDIKATGEFKGKNACTAWVNFDGTTTPPTIRDSFNVSMVIRTGTGVYDIYFETSMDNINYSVAGSGVGNTTGNNNLIITSNGQQLGTSSFGIRTGRNTDNAAYNGDYCLLMVFGGKN